MNIQASVHRIALAATLCLAALLAACGGGGGSAESAPSGKSESVDNAADDTPSSPDDPSTPAPAAGRKVKWNPGHYAVVGTNAGPQAVDRALSETARFPWVKGLVIRTTWPEIETSQGKYDFSTIDADIEKAAARGKRVFILMGTKSFSGDDKAVPAYLRTAEYGGGAFRIQIKRGGYGENAAIYNSRVADRLQALYQALGNRYNTDNNVEGVIFNETALGMAVKPLTPAQQQAQFSNLARVNIAARNAFANSNMIQYMNSPMTLVPQLWRSMQGNGIGVGGPDVFVNDKSLNKLLPSYAAASGDVPIGVQVEGASYYSYKHNGPFAPPAVSTLFAFARDRMKANYVFWVPDESEPHNPWPKVLNMWASASFPKDSAGGLSAKCPSGIECASKL